MKKKICAVFLAGVLAAGLCACAGPGGGSEAVTTPTPAETSSTSPASSTDDSTGSDTSSVESSQTSSTESVDPKEAAFRGSTLTAYLEATSPEEKEKIETALDISKNEKAAWTYDASSNTWTMAVVPAVLYPEIENLQGVSICVPGAYVLGVDTNGDGKADVRPDNYQNPTAGSLVSNTWGYVATRNGQVYKTETAPTVVLTGEVGYEERENALAPKTYAKNGLITVSCGCRGASATATDGNGLSYFTGNAPSGLVDTKNAIRFVKYNMLLGNLPGNVDYFVTAGGAFAAMAAATSNNRQFYDYEIEAGAAGVYRKKDGTYSTTITVNGENMDISDGVWGTVSYGPVTSLDEADMALAFEHYMDPNYVYESEMEEVLADNLAQAYMEYVNRQKFKITEEGLGIDLDGDEELETSYSLSIDYDEVGYSKTHGFGGSYLDYCQREFVESLQEYLDNLAYTDGWTWFDANGARLGDWAVSSMTPDARKLAFLEGRYARAGVEEESTKKLEKGTDSSKSAKEAADSETSSDSDGSDVTVSSDISDISDVSGALDASKDSAASDLLDSSETYASFTDLLAAYEKDIVEQKAGDRYGNNLVDLYNPMSFIGLQSTENPTWARLVMGAAGDMPLLPSFNLQLRWLSVGTDASIEWQWDGGDVPTEVLGATLSYYVDQMFSKHEMDEEEAKVISRNATAQTKNGYAEAPTGKDISSWVNHDDLSKVTFPLASAAAYRTANASSPVPSFDAMDWKSSRTTH